MRYSRQDKILEIISENEIETQDALAEKLAESGFSVTRRRRFPEISKNFSSSKPSPRADVTNIARAPQAPSGFRHRKPLS